MDVIQLSKEQWANFSEHAHKIVFSEAKPKEWDRIDYALMAIDSGQPMGYVSCREMDSATVYWQFGGAFPSSKDTVKVFRAYRAFIEWAQARYERVATYIENTNLVMLKMAMKVGFRVIGVRNFHGSILLEHLLEW